MAGKKKKAQKNKKGENGGVDSQPQLQLKPQPQLQLKPQPSTEAEWSEFERNLGISSQRWGSPDVKSFWLLACHESEVYSTEYYVYAVHLKSPSNTPLKLQPILHWYMTCDHYAYAILGLTLYMFGGLDSNDNFTNTVRFYDMQTALFSSSTTRLDEGSIKPGPEMKAKKICPLAVCIDDFRICVFSSVLWNFVTYGAVFFPNFELFDTTESKWTSLPDPMSYDSLHADEVVYITSYCVHGSILVISTNKGIFGINLQNPHADSKWFKLAGSESICSFPFDGEISALWTWTMLGEYMCNSFFAVRRGDLTSSYFYVESSTERESLISLYEHGLLFGGAKDDGYTNLYMVRTGVPAHKHTPHLLVDIVKLDGTQSDWRNIRSEKSFTFSLTSFSPCLRMSVFGCFPFEIADTGMEEAAREAASEEKEIKNIEDEKAAGDAEDAKVEHEVRPKNDVETELVKKPADEAGSGEGSTEMATETVVEKAYGEGNKGILDVAIVGKKENGTSRGLSWKMLAVGGLMGGIAVGMLIRNRRFFIQVLSISLILFSIVHHFLVR